MVLADNHPFDTFIAEVRRHFFELPRVHERANTLSNVVYEVLAVLSEAEFLHLLTDLYLHKDRQKTVVPREELSGDTLQETLEDVLIGAAVHLLRQDSEVEREDTIRRGFEDRLKAGYQQRGGPRFLDSASE